MDTIIVNIRNRRKHLQSEEKDHVLRVAVTVAVILLVIGILIVAVRLMNPRVDTRAGREKLEQMEEVQVSDVDRQIQELEEAERIADEEAADAEEESTDID